MISPVPESAEPLFRYCATCKQSHSLFIYHIACSAKKKKKRPPAKVQGPDAPAAFYLQLGGRRYYIKAKTALECDEWVTGLMQRRDGDAESRSESMKSSSPVTSPKQVELQEVAASAGRQGKPAVADVDKSMRNEGVCGSCVVL